LRVVKRHTSKGNSEATAQKSQCTERSRGRNKNGHRLHELGKYDNRKQGNGNKNYNFL